MATKDSPEQPGAATSPAASVATTAAVVRAGALSESADSAEAAESRRAVRNRLRRAHGQLGALIEAVDAGANCRDAVTQLSAIAKALDRAGFLMIAHAMQECVAVREGEAPEDALTVDELEKLFLSLA